MSFECHKLSKIFCLEIQLHWYQVDLAYHNSSRLKSMTIKQENLIKYKICYAGYSLHERIDIVIKYQLPPLYITNSIAYHCHMLIANCRFHDPKRFNHMQYQCHLLTNWNISLFTFAIGWFQHSHINILHAIAICICEYYFVY